MKPGMWTWSTTWVNEYIEKSNKMCQHGISKGKFERIDTSVVKNSNGEFGCELFFFKGDYPSLDQHVCISQVDEDSPAQRSGLRVGDKIVEIDGTDISKEQSYVKVKDMLEACGQSVRLCVKRCQLEPEAAKAPEAQAAQR